MENAPDWIKNPTKEHLFWISLVWVLSVGLVVLAITDFFTETIFQKRALVLLILMIGSGVAVFRVYKNFYKKK